MADTVQIRRKSDGELFEGPAGSEISADFELVGGTASRSTTSLGLAGSLWDSLRSVMPEAPADWVTHASTLTSPIPHFASPETLEGGRSIARHGIPAATSMIGAGTGGIPGAAVMGAGGDLLGQWAAGEPTDLTSAGISGVLGGVGAGVGRLLNTGLRAGEGVLRKSGIGAMIPGLRGAYSTADAADAVAMPELQKTVSHLLDKYNRIVGPSGQPVETAARKTVAELDQLDAIFKSGVGSGGSVPLRDADTIRNLIGDFIQGNKAVPEGRALYAALMSDLRAAAGSSSNAAAYLRDLGNDRILKAVMPKGWLEMAGLTLSGAGALAGHPAVMVPQLGYMAARGMAATPPGVLDPLMAGAGQLGYSALGRPNPFRGGGR